jgi:hypothetical protein
MCGCNSWRAIVRNAPPEIAASSLWVSSRRPKHGPRALVARGSVNNIGGFYGWGALASAAGEGAIDTHG